MAAAAAAPENPCALHKTGRPFSSSSPLAVADWPDWPLLRLSTHTARPRSSLHATLHVISAETPHAPTASVSHPPGHHRDRRSRRRGRTARVQVSLWTASARLLVALRTDGVRSGQCAGVLCCSCSAECRRAAADADAPMQGL